MTPSVSRVGAHATAAAHKAAAAAESFATDDTAAEATPSRLTGGTMHLPSGSPLVSTGVDLWWGGMPSV